jgi:hypothetical protein
MTEEEMEEVERMELNIDPEEDQGEGGNHMPREQESAGAEPSDQWSSLPTVDLTAGVTSARWRGFMMIIDMIGRSTDHHTMGPEV